MQDLQLMQSGGGGRFFGAERRLRPYPNQALKCPRCDSLNTKFCYYNNYNLSQPRHFCKSCRRYWTKGGVLRNVPVGGGCRKTKRSKPKSSDQHKEQKKSHSNSSSDSSSFTPTTTTTTNDVPADSSSVPALLNFQNSRIVADQTTLNPDFEMVDDPDQNSESGIFVENGSFTSLMNLGNTYNFSEILPFQLNHQEDKIREIELQQQQQQQEKMIEEMKMHELTGGIDFSEIQNRNSTGELTALDWQSSQGLMFDLPPNSVDHQGYWSQSQWTTDTNQHIYLP